MAYAKKYRTVKLQLYFLLSLGYFKAKQLFYATDLIMGSAQDAQYNPSQARDDGIFLDVWITFTQKHYATATFYPQNLWVIL